MEYGAASTLPVEHEAVAYLNRLTRDIKATKMRWQLFHRAQLTSWVCLIRDMKSTHLEPIVYQIPPAIDATYLSQVRGLCIVICQPDVLEI